MKTREILDRLTGVKETTSGWQARCPAHKDKNPSLSITERDGKTLLKCHAGCTTDAVCEAVGITTADLFTEEKPDTRKTKAATVKTEPYEYKHADGSLYGIKERYDKADGSKSFAWKQHDKTRKAPLYRIEQAANAEDIIILVEGERKADQVSALDYVAISLPAGAGATITPEQAAPLKGKDVILLPDNDKPGQKSLLKNTEVLRNVCNTLRAAKVPAPYNDIVDLFNEIGNDPEKRLEVLQDLLIDSTDIKEPVRLAVDAFHFASISPAEPDCILEDTFEAMDKIAVIGRAKDRKTFFVLQLALSIAIGRPFLGWQVTRRRRVLVVQFEIKELHYHRRVNRMAAAMGVPAGLLRGQMFVISARGKELTLDTIAGEAKRLGAELIVFDPLFKMTEGDENKAQDVKPILAAFDRLAEDTGAAVLYVHHDCKGSPGDRDIRDRGAGSNVLARDYDACFTLTSHADEESTVIHTLLRNFAPQPARTVKWDDGYFQTSELAPVVRRGNSKPSQYKPIVEKILKESPDIGVRELARQASCDPSTASRIKKQIEGVA